jgi:putative FmdB family regulatory protein
MPTYEYECTHCKHTCEAFQQMSDKHIEKCPKCGKKVKRLISSGSGIIFKGSGFYATDYKKKTKSDSECSKSKDGCKSCPHAH